MPARLFSKVAGDATALASVPAVWRPTGAFEPASGTRVVLLAILLLFAFVQPLHAQVGASVTLTSDDLFRGESISNGDPALIASISWDGSSGLYAAADAAFRSGGGAPRLVNLRGNVGYAVKIGQDATFDLGLIGSHYSKYGSGGEARHYTEVYAGVVFRGATFRLHFSPDYLSRGRSRLYGDAGLTLSPAPDWQVSAHAGVLVSLSGPTAYHDRSARVDWRLGLERRLGKFTVAGALIGSGSGSEFYEGKRSDGARLVVSVTRTL